VSAEQLEFGGLSLSPKKEASTPSAAVNAAETGADTGAPAAPSSDAKATTDSGSKTISKATKKASPKVKPKVTSAPEPLGKPTLYLVDGSNIAFRAHYGIRGLTNSKGQPTNALFGYCSQLFRLFKDYDPDYMVICWDPKGDTFRSEIFPDYKGTRPDMPDELRAQWPRFAEIDAALGIASMVESGFEADDLIGTLAVRFKDVCNVTIVTGDKDMMQLVEGQAVTILDTMKEQRIGPDQVVEKWGVRPDQIIDILSLMGDTSDNIPGVARIGQKGAAQLIQDWGSMQGAFEHAEEVTGRNRKPLLAEGAKESAELSYELATIKIDMELSVDLDALKVQFPPQEREAVTELFGDLEFHRFLAEMGGEMKSVSSEGHRCVSDEEDLRAALTALRGADSIAIDVLTRSDDANRSELVGLALCGGPDVSWYIPLGHEDEEGAPVAGQLPLQRCLLYLRALFENPRRRFVGQNLGFVWTALASQGVEIAGVQGDLQVASFLMNAERKSHDLEALALTWLRHKMPSKSDAISEVGGVAARLSIEVATELIASRAHVIWLLREEVEKSVDEQGLAEVYRNVDLPLVPILARMQLFGIGIDVSQLESYSLELGESIEKIQALTWEHAGREFNSSSPKQLAQILFEELGLPIVKKTKTGPSTDASVLEELSSMHPLPEAILRYRSLTKLKSTYVDALPPLVNPETGRIHTHYSQTVAATGRLSSRDPNLQNIPIRTAEGRRIRAAFIPDPGHVFLSADYSQVELRVLAHLCGGEGGFARAFAEGKDVHRLTAAEVFNIAEGDVTPEMRSTAKAINFGLVYGQTDFGLARSLHISRKEAKAYIERYKERYPEIDSYMEETVAYALEHGYVRTLLGRRRPVAGLTSSNFNQRNAARRVAINTPVQGSAADIMKIAMLRVDEMLRQDFPEVRMLLQVHDELGFTVA
jgi:DNA polymerase-1